MDLDFAPIEGDAPFVFGPIQTKWLEALESGKYEQGHGQLKERGRFCCLGVLCELMNIPWVESDTHGHGYRDKNGEEVTTNGNMPKELSQQAGFRDDIGGFKVSRNIKESRSPHNYVGSLVGCNDLAKLSFKQIAELVRYDPYNVFNIPA